MESFGRYQLHEQLGQGGMGVVYRAHDTVLERIVALKLVGVSYTDDPEMRERFFREARAAAQLTHKNIVTVYDLGEHDGRPYLAMEYLAGEDLQRRLARPDRMPFSRRLEVACEICEGVAHAHAHGIVHRDLKPANIYLAEDGGVKILDFGLARPMASQLTQSNMLVGTINYMAPEQVRAERADNRSDIFSLGVVFYELFGGRKAFESDSVASTLYKILEDVPEPLFNLDSEIPLSLWKVVERALAKNREDRYQQVTALLGDLRESAHPAHPSVTSWPGTLTPPSITRADSIAQPPLPPSPSTAAAPSATRPPIRRTALFASAIAVAAAAVLGAAWFLTHGTGPQPSESTQSAAPSSSPTPSTQPAPAAPGAGTAAQSIPPPPTTVPAPAADENARKNDGAAIAARQQAEAARSRMTDQRAAAETAGAPEHAVAAFRNATRRAQDGERLFKTGKYDQASSRYYEATGLFRDAEAAARSATAPPRPTVPSEPPPQKAPQQGTTTPPGTNVAMPPPPVVVPPAPPSSPASSVPSSQPSAAAPAPPRPSPPAAPQGPTDEERVNELVNRYREALEARSLERVKQLWPSLSGAAENAMRDEFQHATRISVAIASPQIAIAGATGRVTFLRDYSVSTIDGQHLQSSSRVTMDVRRTAGGWVIESVRFSPR